MALERTVTCNGESKKDNVFARLLSLPAVSSTYEAIERTYTSTKQTHPLICSVCEVYERGARTAGSLAVWSIQPAIHRLEHQLVAANTLACQGLDRLEEKIPALQYPPEKLASGIAEVVSSTVQTAKDGITGPIVSTSDTVLSLGSGGFQLTKSALSDGLQYVLSSKPVRLAEEGADTALTLTERLVSYILPASSEEIEDDASCELEPVVSSPGPQPSSRLGALASTVYRRAYDQMAAQLQRTTSQGRDLVTRIPGVPPLADYAMKNLQAMRSVVLGIASSVAGLLNGNQQQSAQETITTDEGEQLQSGGVQSLVSGLGQQLQSAYVSVVSGVKSAPQTTLGLAKNGASIVLESFGNARERVLNNISYYSLLPGLSSSQREELVSAEEKERGTSGGRPSQGSHGADQRQGQTHTTEQHPAWGVESSEPQISAEARLLQQDVLRQIPMQQRMVLGGSQRTIPTHSPTRRGQTEMRSHGSAYTRSVHVSRYSSAT